MQFLSLVLFLAPALCANVQVIWSHEKATGHTSLSVYDDADLLAHACSSTLQGDTKIDFSDVDANGFGNFTFGDETYLIHSKSHISGGPSCSKKYNALVASIECTGLSWDPSGAPEPSENDCFETVQSRDVLKRFASRAVQHANSDVVHERSSVDTRSPVTPVCVTYTGSQVIGDGMFSEIENFM